MRPARALPRAGRVARCGAAPAGPPGSVARSTGSFWGGRRGSCPRRHGLRIRRTGRLHAAAARAGAGEEIAQMLRLGATTVSNDPTQIRQKTGVAVRSRCCATHACTGWRRA